MTNSTAPAATARLRIEERAGSMLGVPGRFYPVHADDANGTTFTSQTWHSETRPIKGYGADAMIHVTARYDDSCRNGHYSFAITAEVRRPRARDVEACGCLHDDIAAVFPELRPLIQWHLTSADGPMQYIANTLYHAGDRDHNGLRKGETRQRMAKGNRPMFELVAVNVASEAIKPAHATNQGFSGGADALALYGLETLYSGELPPPVPVLEWRPLMTIGDGKARDLKAARASAVWPNATDAELSVEPAELKQRLEERHPLLMGAFKGAMRGAGFLYSPADVSADDENSGECETCAASIETRCFPCEECGHSDEHDD